jgi:transposase InsO family protein
MSVSKLVDDGITVTFNDEGCSLVDNNKNSLLFRKLPVDGLYYTADDSPTGRCMTVTPVITAYEWHRRLGHLSLTGMLAMSTSYNIDELKNINEEETKKIKDCKGCLKGKAHRAAMPKERTTKSSTALELIHSDICGPMSETSTNGSKYFVTFIDDFTRYVTVMFMKKRSEVLECFKKFKTIAETQTNEKIKCFRSDGGKEYLSNKFNTFLSDNGIRKKHDT